uniref:H0124E07.2 protein n=1 Tax=Oryza sativa TaxID=4530 RepID=Q25AH1_ORYSA|nr:H0124E07.2 [Oryza sativa]
MATALWRSSAAAKGRPGFPSSVRTQRRRRLATATATAAARSGWKFKHAIHLNFRATNNTAEYEGLLAGIRAAAVLGVKRLIVKGDSELVANQKCSSPELSKYLAEVRKLEKKPLVKVANDEDSMVVPDISSGATEAERAVADIETTDDWRILLIKFLSSDELPEDDAEAEKLSRQVKIYCMIGNDLYKKAPNGVLLKCISSDDGKHLLLDIHEGICGSHTAGQTLVEKAFQQGFFWPTALKDSCDMVQRYGLPHRIIIENISQFISADFQDYCIGLGVKICFASVSHPQSNGQVERANGIILQGIKTRVYDRLMSHDKKWVEELPSVLWAKPCSDIESTRVQKYSVEDQEEQQSDNVNLLEEHRERVAVKVASYQQALRQYHEKRIRAHTLSIGDYVLRRVQSQAGRNELSPKWEGPYTITQVLRPGAFKIADGDGRELANSWNIDQLRKFYV